MTMLPMTKLETLPKWAQSTIRNLEEEIRRLTSDLELAHAVPGPIRKSRVAMSHLGNERPLPEYPIVFWVNENRIRVRLDDRKGFLEVQAVDGALSIVPCSANVVHIRPIRVEDV